jgi:hypothetical protein
MTTPNGHPAWIRSNDHTTYGGNINKHNWQGQGPVNAQTDPDAQEFCRMAEDLACCARIADFAEITWTCNDGTPAAPTINSANLMTGVTTSYEGDAAPAGYPSGARNGDGDCTFTFPSSPTDDYGVSEALVICHALAGSGVTGTYATYVISGATVRVRIITASSGVGTQDATGTLVVSS